jgi:hypothetical protein
MIPWLKVTRSASQWNSGTPSVAPDRAATRAVMHHDFHP